MINSPDDVQNVAPDNSAVPITPGDNSPAPAQQPQAAQPGAVSAPVQPQTPSPVQNQSDTVSNAPSPAPTHPSVQKAGVIRTIAETLAGGPRYKTSIDPVSGETTRTRVPLTRGDVALAIAMEAISGGLAGLSQRGPGAVGRAASAGFSQVSAQQQEAQQQAEQQAQQDAQNRASALARAAAIHEQNARTILTTQQSERLGLESLKDAVDQNAALLQSYKDTGVVSDTNVVQDALLAGMQSGKYNALSMTALPDGWTNVPGKGYEQTFSIVNNPETKITLTQDDVDRFAAAHVRGFPKGMKIPSTGYPVAGYILGNAHQQLLANKFMLQEASDVRDTLAKSGDPASVELAKSIPDLGKLMDDEKNGLAFQNALPKLQKYMHHDGTGDSFYEALVQMAQPTRPNPTDPKKSIDNSSDANAAQVIAAAYGDGDPTKGWKVLRAYHDTITPAPIKSETEAESIVSDPASSPRQIAQAKKFLNLATQQKATDARADEQARAAVKAANDAAASGQPDAFGFTPNIAAMGGVKEYNKRLNPYKKNTDDLARTEASYQQFAQTLSDLAAGKDMTGAQSVVGLFNAIGLSATPLAGRGFRISENVIKEHEQARGWGQALQAKLLNAKNGDVITPQQLKDYASIAVQARQSQYINLVNEMHSAGLSADAALPTGNGQRIDAPTARIFLILAGGDRQKARAAATAKGFQF